MTRAWTRTASSRARSLARWPPGRWRWLLVALAFAPCARAGAPDYLIACQGGGDMTVELRPRGNDTLLLIGFGRASQAAQSRPPGAGQCAWMDRPVGPDETNVLYARALRTGVDVTLSADGRLLRFSVGNVTGRTASVAGDAQIGTNLAATDGLLNAVRQGRPFQLRVRSVPTPTPAGGRGRVLEITRFGP